MTKKLELEVVARLKSQNLTLSCAESCTGGMLSGLITSVSGASEVFPLGIVSYAPEMKRDLLKVPKETLQTLGTISPDTAYYMAKGIANMGKTDLGVSITGVAGPSKSEGKPVGLVYIGVCFKENCVVYELNENSTLSREAIRESAINTALKLILKVLENGIEYNTESPYTLKKGNII